MLELADLGLTMFQILEVEEADPAVVDAWLARASDPEIRSPTGFFLKGLRTGKPPDDRLPERARIITVAEHWVERVGCLYDRESDMLGELFDQGLLRHLADDVELQKRMVTIWAKHRPAVIAMEEVEVERQRRNGEAYRAIKEVKKDGTEAAAEPVGGPADPSAA
jgi:hypothetical protein